MSNVVRIPVSTDIDVVTAYVHGRELATRFGFSSREVYDITMAVSEVARNIVTHAGSGEVSFTEVAQSGCRGLLIVASDQGPGIADIDLAMALGYSSGGGLGLGLQVVAEIMDEFSITSSPGQGTTVKMTKWHRPQQVGSDKKS